MGQSEENVLTFFLFKRWLLRC